LPRSPPAEDPAVGLVVRPEKRSPVSHGAGHARAREAILSSVAAGAIDQPVDNVPARAGRS